MKSILSVALLTTASAVLYAAPVTVTCSAPLRSSVTSGAGSAASCISFTNGSSYSAGGASATANVSLQLAANGADFSSLSTYQSAYAQQAPRQATNTFGAAAGNSIEVAYQSTLSTTGPVRAGYLQIEGYGYGANIYDGGAVMTSGLLFGSNATSGNYQTEVSCYSNANSCTPGTNYYSSNSLIPVMLGTTFTIEANGHTANSASIYDGSSGGSLNTVYRFRFVEADGLTPVLVTSTPEPATVGLIGMAFSGLLVLRKRRACS